MTTLVTMPECDHTHNSAVNVSTADLAAGICRVFDPQQVELIDPADPTRPKSTTCVRPLVLGRCQLDPLALTGDLVEPEAVWLTDAEVPAGHCGSETVLAFWDAPKICRQPYPIWPHQIGGNPTWV